METAGKVERGEMEVQSTGARGKRTRPLLVGRRGGRVATRMRESCVRAVVRELCREEEKVSKF